MSAPFIQEPMQQIEQPYPQQSYPYPEQPYSYPEPAQPNYGGYDYYATPVAPAPPIPAQPTSNTSWRTISIVAAVIVGIVMLANGSLSGIFGNHQTKSNANPTHNPAGGPGTNSGSGTSFTGEWVGQGFMQSASGSANYVVDFTFQQSGAQIGGPGEDATVQNGQTVEGQLATQGTTQGANISLTVILDDGSALQFTGQLVNGHITLTEQDQGITGHMQLVPGTNQDFQNLAQRLQP